ncbi:MAG TPA: methyltransferase [Candidatus Binatia bacterium]|nr:methyltransferase [Candidatus Binatia bacterium]
MSAQGSGYAELMAIAVGYQASRAVMVAAELGIADVLRDDTRSVADIAAATATHPPTLYRLLRALASIGVLHEDDERRFSLTAMGRHLRSDAPGSPGALARFFGRDYQWAAWGHLLHSVRTGENAMRALYGVDVWKYREERPEENEIFNAAMAAMSTAGADRETAAFDFGRSVVADVGGGTGTLIATILRRNPEARGILYDQPHVVAGAAAVLERAGVADRVRVEAGSFFERAPEGADVYVLRHILHDWPDQEAVAILRSCRRAMKADARLLVLDCVVGPPNQDPPSKFLDLVMLVSAGGRERSEPEWRALLAEGGFRWERVSAASPRAAVIEARPA